MKLYEKVKEKAMEQGKTIISIEKELGFPRGSIFKWDENIPSVAKVAAVAKLFGCSIDELLGD